MKHKSNNSKYQSGFGSYKVHSVLGILSLFCCALLISCKELDNHIVDSEAAEPTVIHSASISQEIRTMSFNIKHDNVSDPLSLDDRKSLILQIITDNDPDIVGLQEFSNNWFETWMENEMTNLGYDIYTVTSTGTPKAIFYKANRFSRLDQGEFEVNLTETRNGTWAVLLDSFTNRSYFICNSHWTTVSSSERQIMANLVKSVVEQNAGGLPVIVLGDFNAQPGTPEISTIKNTTGSNSLVCSHHETGDTFHGWDGTGNSKLDWIFSSRDLAFTSSKVIETNYGGNWPSDHWPIMADFVPAYFGGANIDDQGISGSASTNYYFADVTGDGKVDKIYWNPTFDSGRTRVYGSNGDGTFSFLSSNTNGTSQSSQTTFYFADVTGDGKADKIYWNPTFDNGNTRVYKSNGDGTFDWLYSNPSGASTSSSNKFYFEDVTGDGKADLISWDPNDDSGHTRVYRSNGDGTFTFLDSNTNGTSQSSLTTFYFADVTGDGKADKIYWNPNFDDGHTRIYGSNGDGTFTFLDSNTTGASGVASTRFYFADVTGDGKADKIYWRPNIYKGKIKIYPSNGDGTFDGPVYSLRGTSQSENTFFYFFDINGDEKADQIRWNKDEAPSGYSSGTLKNYFAN
ncbi:VCBS repeat-containing protein [Echinicola sp. CAU 1574]|uniref:VCBS repeat-containing protein n=1 Tax=Echinicola arenosa TaxID=2774144 RepID=A0ABR9AFA1_9BACT|nr:FG-GAP-like repeat-containing protein [Echinicola arenosa]MBD8487372.1 VCBS repeat-containing protein [Echinicola arenosa]